MDNLLFDVAPLVDAALTEDGEYLVVAATLQSAGDIALSIAATVEARVGTESEVRRYPYPIVALRPGTRVHVFSARTERLRGMVFRAAAVLVPATPDLLAQVVPTLLPARNAEPAEV